MFNKLINVVKSAVSTVTSTLSSVLTSVRQWVSNRVDDVIEYISSSPIIIFSLSTFGYTVLPTVIFTSLISLAAGIPLFTALLWSFILSLVFTATSVLTTLLFGTVNQ